jgi:hypothetical protein
MDYISHHRSFVVYARQPVQLVTDRQQTALAATSIAHSINTCSISNASIVVPLVSLMLLLPALNVTRSARPAEILPLNAPHATLRANSNTSLVKTALKSAQKGPTLTQASLCALAA